MSETITTYELREHRIPIPMDRKEFYDEQIKVYKKIGKPTKACEIVDLILFNTDGQIILQKRSHNKNHNPSLIDKAVGGHVQFDDSPFYTIMVETVQELRVPSIVLYNDEDFKKTRRLLHGYLDHIAILQNLDEKIFELEKIIKGETIKIANKVHLFLGVYEGATKPVDMEASGILYYDLSVLKEEMKTAPQMFTNDLHIFLKEYEKDINQFIKNIKTYEK